MLQSSGEFALILAHFQQAETVVYYVLLLFCIEHGYEAVLTMAYESRYA